MRRPATRVGGWLRRHRGSLAVVTGCAMALVLAGPMLAPHDPQQANILNRLAAPSLAHPLGTDAMGRCLLSRLLHGAQLTTAAALAVVTAAAGLGTLIGALSGYFGGACDRLLMRLTEGVSVIPALALAMVIAGVLGLGLKAVVLALACVH
jgi:peptide/nickel transport system permease protein/nickel transport system permease protein